MNRKKHPKNNRKDFPLSIDLRNFLMYSNPARFAPKLKKTGGEAYPQAPTMNQFFDYGHPTPQTPFVFQNGGSMNDIQKMTMMHNMHYGRMAKGGESNFSGKTPNKTAEFLKKIKERAYNSIQRDLEQEEMGLQEGYNQAAMQMDYFQYGGGYNLDFSAANAWANAANNTANMGDLVGDFSTILGAYNATPTDTYIKSIKTKQIPTAQDGLEFRSNLQNQMNLPFDYSNVGPQAGMMYGVNATNTQPYQNVMTENIPGMGVPMNGMISSGEGFGYGRNLISTEDPYGSEDEWITPSNPTAGINRDEALAYWRKQNGRDFMSAEDAASLMNKPVNDPNYPMMKSKDIYPIKEKTSIIDKTVAEIEKKKEETKQANAAVAEDTPPAGTEIITNPDGTQSSISPAEAARRAEEKKKKEEEESNCPDGKCGKPGNITVNANTPPEGTQIVTNPDGTESSISPAEVARRKAEEEKNQADAAGMTPEQYRTFLTRASVNNRRALLPGNRLKSMDFYFDTYGPGMNSITGSAGQSLQNGNVSQGANGNNQRSGISESDYINRNYTDEGSRVAGSGQGSPDYMQMKSTYDPTGYNNAYSDFRNQIFQNRRNRIGSKLDALASREADLNDKYNQGLSPRESKRYDRLKKLYNEIGTGRPAPGMYMGPQQEAPITFSKYGNPEFTKAYGGSMGYFQGDEGTSQVNDPFGTAGYSTDGSDMTEREDYMGNTIYQRPPLENDINQSTGLGNPTKSRTRVKFGHYNPYEAPLLLAGMQGLAGARKNAQARRNEGIFTNKMSADQVFTEMPNMSRGNYTANEGYFRPNKMVPVEEAGYNFKSAYAKMGGSYKKGGEYYLTEDEINELIQNGGQVEFLD